MTKKTWIVFVAVCVLLFGSLIYLSKRNDINVSGIKNNSVLPASVASGNIADHVFGDAGSKVIFIEYGDYECPYCGDAYPQVKKVTDKYQGQVAFIFRNLPLTSLHPNARIGAAAAEAAGLQGKYWQMHDLLYENQNAWSGSGVSDRTAVLVSYAKSLGLDTTKFTADLTSDAVNKKIDFDRAVYNSLGLAQSTPTFFLNGTKLSDTLTADLVSGDGSKTDAALAAAITSAGMQLPK